MISVALTALSRSILTAIKICRISELSVHSLVLRPEGTLILAALTSAKLPFIYGTMNRLRLFDL